MTDVLSVDNMRKSDAATIAAGTSGRELMMRAARGVFDACFTKEALQKRGSSADSQNVAIICGSGNNAGDGYALALLLKKADIDRTIILTSEKFSDDGKYYFDQCKEEGIPVIGPGAAGPDLSGFTTIVDCLLGTGFRGEVRPELAAVIDAINNSAAYTISVDINSGLNGDTGMGKTCVVSDITVSVGSFKPGHFLNMAKDVMKDKVNVDIGIKPVDASYHLIEASDVRSALGIRKNFSNKGTYGYTALIGGSTKYSGAIRLAYLANAAMRSGAGVVKIALPGSLVHDVTAHILESTIFPLSDTSDVMSTNVEVRYVKEEIDELTANVKTVAFGMGVGTGEGAAKILSHLIENYEGTLIIDADALTLASKLERSALSGRKGVTVLTPHIKEFSRLTGLTIDEILEDPIGIAQKYAKETGAIILLKGPSTIVTDGERVFITDRGCAGMATAGSGDVLSGILAAVTAYVDDKCLATAVGAYINGVAGEAAASRFGDISMTAGDTAAFIPEVLRSID